MHRLVLGTAGHIDHGKTALVRALTGTDTDRLPEEKRRGITIDIGFASLRLDPADAPPLELDVVDVPGHEAFVRNMLAGASGIDLVLLVIAADEGVMPQTREHLAIIELLGVSRGVVALTKSDLVDDDWLELVREDVTALLSATRLGAAPVVPVSARTGAGLDALRDALHTASRDVMPRSGDDIFRMPVDRVFSVHGTGTVVTGTVWSGRLRVNDTVRIEPAGLTARVRALQHQGAAADVVAAGARAAIALNGVDRDQVRRGDAILTGTAWAAAPILTVDLTVVGDAAAPLRHRQRVRVHAGTAEVLARVVPLEGDIEPGATRLAQLRLETPIVARAGDRIVLRSYSPALTIGGGMVLEPQAPKRKRLTPRTATRLRALAPAADAATAGSGSYAPQSAVRALVELHGGTEAARLTITAGLSPSAVPQVLESLSGDVAIVGDLLLPTTALAAFRDAVLDQLRSHHLVRPLEDGLEREALRRRTEAAAGTARPPAALFETAMNALLDDGSISSRSGVFALAGHAPEPDPGAALLIERLAAIHATAGLQAPDTGELPPELGAHPDLPLLLRHLERNQVLVRVTPTRWTDAAAVLAATSLIHTQLPAGQPLGVAEFRDLLGLTRKHLIPLLEFFDRTGITTRNGDARVVVPTPRKA